MAKNTKTLKRVVHLPIDGVNSGLSTKISPSVPVAIASVLAKWFDQIIRARRLQPNLKDEYIFSVLRSQLEKNCGNKGFRDTIRKALKDYGYKIRLGRSQVIITKYR